MADRTHEIACPCCGATLVVDADSGAILSHVAPKKGAHVSFEKALGEVEAGKKRAEARFSQAMEQRSRQSEILDKKFKKALEKASEDPTPPKSPFENE